MDDGASGEDLITLETPRLILRQWQPTAGDRHVIAQPPGDRPGYAIRQRLR